MENDDPIVLELEARLAEACCVGTESTLTEIRGRALAALEPLFLERAADLLNTANVDDVSHQDWPDAIEWLRDRAASMKRAAGPLDRRQTP